MERLVKIGLGSATAILVIMLLYGLVDNPMKERRRLLIGDLNNVESDWEDGAGNGGTPPQEAQQIIVAQASLWRGLIEAPPPPPKPFDMEGALKGVSPTRRSIGSGADMKARIETPSDPRGEYYGVGDTIPGTPGVTVKEVTRDYVLFTKTHEGKEYTKRIAR